MNVCGENPQTESIKDGWRLPCPNLKFLVDCKILLEWQLHVSIWKFTNWRGWDGHLCFYLYCCSFCPLILVSMSSFPGAADVARWQLLAGIEVAQHTKRKRIFVEPTMTSMQSLPKNLRTSSLDTHHATQTSNRKKINEICLWNTMSLAAAKAVYKGQGHKVTGLNTMLGAIFVWFLPVSCILPSIVPI